LKETRGIRSNNTVGNRHSTHVTELKNQYRPTDTRKSSSYNTAGLEDNEPSTTRYV